MTEQLTPANECRTEHYGFKYHMRFDEHQQGWIIIDPYAVAQVWKLGERDPSGCLFHVLKTLSRLGLKEGNSVEREIRSMELSLARYREVRKINELDIDPDEYNI